MWFVKENNFKPDQAGMNEQDNLSGTSLEAH